VAVLEIITVPHPMLSGKAREVRDDEFGDDLVKLTADMAETMYAAPGVGLAAPQVADARRIVVVDPTDGEERGTGLLHMVNPTITERSKDMILWWETCLSVPDLEVKVERHLTITVEWRTPTGEKKTASFEEFPAVVIQHELDHLLGTVLLDRVSRFRRGKYLKTHKSKSHRK
jgi:peptide deformylase